MKSLPGGFLAACLRDHTRDRRCMLVGGSFSDHGVNTDDAEETLDALTAAQLAAIAIISNYADARGRSLSRG